MTKIHDIISNFFLLPVRVATFYYFWFLDFVSLILKTDGCILSLSSNLGTLQCCVLHSSTVIFRKVSWSSWRLVMTTVEISKRINQPPNQSGNIISLSWKCIRQVSDIIALKEMKPVCCLSAYIKMKEWFTLILKNKRFSRIDEINKIKHLNKQKRK